jgi:hypothetical protein
VDLETDGARWAKGGALLDLQSSDILQNGQI